MGLRGSSLWETRQSAQIRLLSGHHSGGAAPGPPPISGPPSLQVGPGPRQEDKGQEGTPNSVPLALSCLHCPRQRPGRTADPGRAEPRGTWAVPPRRHHDSGSASGTRQTLTPLLRASGRTPTEAAAALAQDLISP